MLFALIMFFTEILNIIKTMIKGFVHNILTLLLSEMVYHMFKCVLQAVYRCCKKKIREQKAINPFINFINLLQLSSLSNTL